MASTTTTISSAASTPVRAITAERVPWYVWCSVLAVTSAMVGGQWDISWHRSIGRDTFWTPAHMAIYLCGVLAGISCGYLILATTFGNFSQLRSTSVTLWGFRGPLGAFIGAWGGVAMLTSAPFDDWWHSAYGLDVKIVSPPHVLLISGTLAVEVGTLVLILGMMNRARDHFRGRLNWLFLYVGGMITMVLMTLLMEFSSRVFMHNAMFYRVVCMFIPMVLAGVARASESRWAATTVAAVYTLVWGAMGWILPLFPAEPKLGPVYNNVTQFVPADFPMLIILPALALDIFWQRSRRIEQMAAGGCRGPVVPGCIHGRAVAVRKFSPVAARAELVFPYQYLRLRRASGMAQCAECLLSAGCAIGFLDGAVHGRCSRHFDDQNRIGVGRLDAACSPLKACGGDSSCWDC